ncbi:MAG TPA: ABC transporter permease [Anaerolineales bacterium]|nr:ABC transporter permease [Anaerolineales bacterium]
MRMIDLVIKDLAQIFRDKRSFLFLVAMPIAFTMFMGFAYRRDEDGEPQDPRLSLAWVQAGPAGELSQMLYARLEESDALKPLRMEQEAALESLERGEVDGVLLIPPGFDRGVEGTLTEYQPNESLVWQIRLMADTVSPKGQSLFQLLRVPVSQLLSAVEIGQMGVDTLGDPAEFTPALELAWEKWEESSSQTLMRVEQAVAQESKSWFGDNPYNQASPGILIQFAVMGLVTSAQILVRERQSRTLQRLMTTALKPWEILVGHMLAMFVLVFLQTVLLIIFGQLILGVDYLRAPVTVLLVAVALGLWVASVGLLIGLLAKGDDQVVLYAMIAMFLFSALGGAWFPLETTGRVFVTIGKALPSAWAMTGLQNVLIRGLGLHSAWLPSGILLAYALGFFLLAVWRFRTMKV